MLHMIFLIVHMNLMLIFHDLYNLEKFNIYISISIHKTGRFTRIRNKKLNSNSI